MKLVWAYKKLAALNEEVGFVGVLAATAKTLIASGDVQDPHIGAKAFKYIDYTPVVVAPASGAPAGGASTEEEDEAPEPDSIVITETPKKKTNKKSATMNSLLVWNGLGFFRTL